MFEFVSKSIFIFRITYCFNDFNKSSLTWFCINGFILFFYNMIEFFNGDVYVYLNVFNVPTGNQFVFFLGLCLNYTTILSFDPL